MKKVLLSTSTNEIVFPIGIALQDDIIEDKMRQIKRQPRISGIPIDVTPLSLLHFSDIHCINYGEDEEGNVTSGSIDNLKRIIAFAEKYYGYLDDTICTGDMVSNNFNDGTWESIWDNASVVNTKQIMYVIGNHEVKDGQTVVSISDAYDKYFTPYITDDAHWLSGVVRPQNATENNLMCWYKDYNSSNVRLIGLDSEYNPVAQAQWFTDVLEDARTKGLHVVAAAHKVIGRTNRIESAFSTFQDYGSSSVPQTLANAVDTFIDNGGDFVCWLGGHTHTDGIGYIGNNNQLCIAIGCASMVKARTAGYGDITRVDGTNSEDLFNIFNVDTHYKCVKLVRIGSHYDCWGRHKGSCCIRYAPLDGNREGFTPQIIYEC